MVYLHYCVQWISGYFTANNGQHSFRPYCDVTALTRIHYRVHDGQQEIFRGSCANVRKFGDSRFTHHSSHVQGDAARHHKQAPRTKLGATLNNTLVKYEKPCDTSVTYICIYDCITTYTRTVTRTGCEAVFDCYPFTLN